MTDAIDLNLSQVNAEIDSGKLLPSELVAASLEKIALSNSEIGAFISVNDGEAIASSKVADQRAKRGARFGPLDGIPISVKDTINTKGLTTTYGAKKFRTRVPSYDDPVVRKLRSAGAIIIGKTNTPEFAKSPDTFGDFQPRCNNPWDVSRSPGGSSGGAAASVAAGVAPWAIATDSGGSIRLPSALCGVVGFKPSQGAVPEAPGSYRGGPVFQRTLTTGPIARSVSDIATIYSTIRCSDAGDAARKLSSSLRIAWVPNFGLGSVDKRILRQLRVVMGLMEDSGHRINELDLDWSDPDPFWALFTLLSIYTPMRFNYDEPATDSKEMTDYAAQFVEVGSSATAVDMAQALGIRDLLISRFRGIFDDYDVVITPSVGVEAWRHSEHPLVVDGERVAIWGDIPYGLWANLSIVSLSGNPALSLPVGVGENGLPIGIQIIGNYNEDYSLIDAAKRIDSILN